MPGKQADLVMISTRSLNMQPVHDPVSAVVMHANQSNIDSVMVAGNWRKRHGRLVRDDSRAVIEALQRSSSRIVGALGHLPRRRAGHELSHHRPLPPARRPRRGVDSDAERARVEVAKYSIRWTDTARQGRGDGSARARDFSAR